MIIDEINNSYPAIINSLVGYIIRGLEEAPFSTGVFDLLLFDLSSVIVVQKMYNYKFPV